MFYVYLLGKQTVRNTVHRYDGRLGEARMGAQDESDPRLHCRTRYRSVGLVRTARLTGGRVYPGTPAEEMEAGLESPAYRVGQPAVDRPLSVHSVLMREAGASGVVGPCFRRDDTIWAASARTRGFRR